MKKINILLFLFILIFLSTNNVYAQCTNQELEIYKKLADEVQIEYKYVDNYTPIYNNEVNTDNKFIFNVSNLSNKIYIVTNPISIISNDTQEEYTNIDTSYFDGGKEIIFKIFTSDKSNCVDETLKIVKINLPVYNKYYQDELCQGLENFEYCQKLIPNEITYEGFKKNVLEYKESLNEIIEVDNEENNILENVSTFVTSNIVIIISSLSIIILTIIFIIFKKIKKKRI